MTASALGEPDLHLIVLDHPLGGVDAPTLSARAADAAAAIGEWLAPILAARGPR